MTELEQAPRKAHGLRWLWLTAAAIFTATTVSACVLTPAQLGLTGQDNSSPTSTPSGTTDQLADKLPEQLLSTEQPSSAPKSGAAKTTTKKAPTVTVGEKLEFGRGVFNPTDPNFKLFNPCTEIAEKQWDNADLVVSEEANQDSSDLTQAAYMQQIQDSSTQMHKCLIMQVSNPDADAYGILQTDAEFIDHQELLSEYILEDPGIPLPEGFAFVRLTGSSGSVSCGVSTNTNRGRVDVAFIYQRKYWSRPIPEACQAAWDSMQGLMDIDGSKLK